MRDGSLILQFERGQVVAVRSNAGLDQFYERLFRHAYRAARRSHSVEPGIQLIVFGGFWLEARANSMLRQTLVLEVREASFAPALWEALKRVPLSDKLGLFLALASSDLQEQFGDLNARLRRLLDLRNRLAHFKDSDTQVSGPVSSLEETIKVLETADDPLLIRELKRPEVLTHGETVSVLAKWLKLFERTHAKARDIRIRSKTTPKGLTKRSSGRASRAADR